MWHWLVDVPSRRLHELAAFVLLPLIALVVSLDVLTRYFLNAPLAWSQDVCTLTLLCVFCAAVPIATQQETHIRIETFYEKFPPGVRALIDAFGCLCGAVFVGFIAYWQYRELPGTYRRGESALLAPIPHWPIALFVGICMTLVAWVLVAQALVALRPLVRGAGR